MKSAHVLLIGMVLATAVAAVFTRTAAQAPRRAVAPVARVAVCDIGAVFNGYERRNDLNRLFEQKRKDAKAEDDKRLDQIKHTQKTLEALRPGSKEHDAQLRRMEKLSIERKVWRQFQEQQFAREHRLLMEQLYRQVLDAIGAVARQKGYDAVFYTDSVEIASQSTSELLTKIAQRKCLYHNPAIELTKDITDLLNRNYGARRGP